MREVWQVIQNWRQAGTPVALATVVEVSGSSLRPEGSKMAISKTGEIAGSVSGGCVEGAVFDEAQAVLRSGEPRLLSYGVSNEQAWEVGLSCGGAIKVFVESMASPGWQSVFPGVSACLAEQRAGLLTTIITGSRAGEKLLLQEDGTQVGDAVLDLRAHFPDIRALHDPRRISLPAPDGETSVFVDVLLPPPRLVIVGAVHIAIPLVSLAKAMDFRTVVVDARSAFATRERFPHADELIVEWPSDALEKLSLDAGTCVVCLSHDEKLDNPALQVALRSPARYVGALGSRTTHAKRLDSLREEGVPEELLARIHAPVGLDLGAKQPDEIALSILAEIVAERHGVPSFHFR